MAESNILGASRGPSPVRVDGVSDVHRFQEEGQDQEPYRRTSEPTGGVGVSPVLPQGGYVTAKQLLDYTLAVLLLILTLPVVVMAMALVRITSPGPALYRQTRVGFSGRKFTILKLRTMYHECERTTGPKWSTGDDPRVTPVGRFLRRSHLDELPQLWNVLRGEMSLVGPRPERPEFVAMLEKVLPGYRYRTLIRPGVTGLAQVQLPPDTDVASARRKLACDLYYFERCGLWLDLRLVAVTALKVVGVPGARSCRWLSIPADRDARESYEAGLVATRGDGPDSPPADLARRQGWSQPPDAECAPA